MRNLILSVCCILNLSVVAQQWIWAKSAIGQGEITSVKADNSGNVFVTGSFINTVAIETITLTGSGSNMFIAKYDTNGNIIWAKSYGQLKSTSICLDLNGNIYATGAFSSSVVTVGSYTLTNAGGNNPGSAGGNGGPCTDLFVLKCDQFGSVIWAKSTGGRNNEFSRSICTDRSGNVFITGVFRSDSVFFDSVMLTNTSWANLFITKYNTNGNVIWANNAEVLDGGFAVGTDSIGNSFVTGEFFNSVKFGNITLTTPNSDLFITKFDPTGNVIWAKNPPIGLRGGGRALTIDYSGNVLIAGWFNGPSITFGSTTLIGNGNGSDPFVAKFDTNGNPLWAKGALAYNGGNDYCESICTNSLGNVFVTGHFESGSISFGSFTLLKPAGIYFPFFIVKYDAIGNEQCATFVADGSSEPAGLGADSKGNVYVGNSLSQMDTLVIGTDTLIRNGFRKIYVAKFNCESAVSISEINKLRDLNIYPNPSSGIFKINFTGVETKVSIYNVFGNCLLNKDCRNDVEQKIDFSCQPKGIYFMEILSEGQRAVKKIVVE